MNENLVGWFANKFQVINWNDYKGKSVRAFYWISHRIDLKIESFFEGQ